MSRQITTSETLSHLQQHPLFNTLPENMMDFLLHHVEPITLLTGQTLFTAGDQGDSMFTIFEGVLGVYLNNQAGDAEQVVAQLTAGETVGEISILTGAHRTATVRAITNTTLIKITRAVFDSIPFEDLNALNAIINKIQERLHRNQMIQTLPRLFGPMQEESLNKFIANAKWIHLNRGERLWEQGTEASSFYITITGRLRFLLSGADGVSYSTGEVGAGETVGEMGMLTGEPRSASVYALRDSTLIGFSSEFFTEISNQYPDLLRQVTKIVINRLRISEGGRQIKKTATQLAIIPLSPRLEFFGERLVNKILSFGDSALFLNAERFNELARIPNAAQLPLDNPNQVRLQALLDELESQHDYVIYQADIESTNWNERINQQSDFLLFAADSADDSNLKPIEKIFDQSKVELKKIRQSLVLLRPKTSPHPTDTARWLTPRNNIQNHFHLISENNADIARLARYITHRSVGVVLSGGGARGFAHIGVLRALKESGVPIDFICGVSSGALVAALYGVGRSYEEIIQIFKSLTRNSADPTLPFISMIQGRKIARRIRSMFNGAQIEDMEIPIYCVSSNLSQAKIYVHRQGNLWEGVLASNTAVGFGPPVILDGDLLMDGNALDNMPADVMAEMLNGGSLIAVDVSKAGNLPKYPSYGNNGLSGWRVLWNKINPFGEKITLPNALTLIMRSQDLSSLVQGKQFRENFIDFYLEPPVQDFNVLGYEKGHLIEQIGYEDAMKNIKKWGGDLHRKSS